MSRWKPPPTRCNRPATATPRTSDQPDTIRHESDSARGHCRGRCCAGTRRVRPRFGTGGRRPWSACVSGVIARRWGAWRRTGGGGSAAGSGRGGNAKRTGGFRGVGVRPLQNLCGDARRSSHGPPDRTRAPRARAAQADISSRNLQNPAVCSLPSLPGMLMLSAFVQTKGSAIFLPFLLIVCLLRS